MHHPVQYQAMARVKQEDRQRVAAEYKRARDGRVVRLGWSRRFVVVLGNAVDVASRLVRQEVAAMDSGERELTAT